MGRGSETEQLGHRVTSELAGVSGRLEQHEEQLRELRQGHDKVQQELEAVRSEAKAAPSSAAPAGGSSEDMKELKAEHEKLAKQVPRLCVVAARLVALHA